MKKHIIEVTNEQLMQMTGISDASLRKLIGNTIPILSDNKFDAIVCVPIINKIQKEKEIKTAVNKAVRDEKLRLQTKFELEKARFQGHGKLSPIEIERIEHQIEKIIVETKRHELRLVKEEDKLIPYDDVKEIVQQEYNTIKSHLLAIPNKVSAALVNISSHKKIYEILQDYIDEALLELSDVDDVIDELPEPDLPEIPEEKT